MKVLPVVIVLLGTSGSIVIAVPVAKPPVPKTPTKAPVEATEETLTDAIEKHDLAAATQILTQNPKLATQGAVPPLHLCAYENEVPIARLLVAKGAKWNAPVDGQTISGATALHYAASQGSLSMIQYLLGIGADINADKDTDITPLQAALKNGRLGTAKWLLEKGADPNALDYNKQNALFYAVYNPAEKGDPAAFVKTLLEKGTDPNAKNFAGETPLFVCVEKDDAPMIAALLAGGAKAEMRNRDDKSALQAAISAHHWKAATALVERSKLDLVDEAGNTPFDLVISEADDVNDAQPELPDLIQVIQALQAKSAPRKNFDDAQLTKNVRFWLEPKQNAARLASVMLAVLPASPLKDELTEGTTLSAARAAKEKGTLDAEEAYRVALILKKKGPEDAAAKKEGVEFLTYATGKLAPDAAPVQVEGIYVALFDAQSGDAKAQDASLEEFIARDPKSANARAIRGRARSDRGDHLRAIDDWNAALQNAPTDPSVGEWHFQRGYSFVMLQKWPLALTEFDAAEKGGVDKGDLWNNRGYAKWKAGDMDGAKADLVKALQKDPLNFDAKLNLADMARADGKTDDAINAYKGLVTQISEHSATNKQKSDVYARLGEIYARQKRDEDAITNFRLSIQYQATATALTNLADLLNFSKRNEEALKHATRATELDPNAGVSWYEKSLALLLLGRTDEALVAASKGIEVAPEEAQTYMVRANIYQSKGMSEEAKRDTEKARQLNNG